MQNKYSGLVSDYQPVVEDKSRVVISYGLEVAEDGEKATWYEVVFYKKQGKPDLEAVKKAVIAFHPCPLIYCLYDHPERSIPWLKNRFPCF